MVRLFDVHAHLDIEPITAKIDKVIENAIANGVKVIITNGTDPKSNRNVLALTKKYPIVKGALGFYPTHVQEYTIEEFDKELEFIKSQDIIAIGEVGLDYKFSDEEKEHVEKLKAQQKVAFQKIIDLAKEKDLPLIIHSRKAELDAIEMLEAANYKKIIMHCFTGKRKLVERIRKNGWTFSIPVTVIKLQQFQDNVRDTPLSQILTETDSPYLGPNSGEIDNEPANVQLVVEKIAEIKGMTVQETSDQLFLNYMRMFN